MKMKFIRLATASRLMTAPTQDQFVDRLLMLTDRQRKMVALAVEETARDRTFRPCNVHIGVETIGK
jgi:hypothetical protein